MSRYSIRIILCTILFYWGMVSAVFATYYSVKDLRDLNPELWDELKLNQYFPNPNQKLEAIDQDRWEWLLQEVVEKLKPRETPGNRRTCFMDVIAKLTGKPRFDPARFPIIWLGFMDIRAALPFDYKGEGFLQQLRNFRSVEFPCQIQWSPIDLTLLSLAGAALKRHKFIGCILNNADFSGTQLIRCSFSGCVLHDIIVESAALVSTSRFVYCQDDESVHSVLMLYKTQFNEAQDPEQKAVLLVQQAYCLKTSGKKDHAAAIIKMPACKALQTVKYLSALHKLKYHELLNEAICSKDTLLEVGLEVYQREPSKTLKLAWALYVLMNLSPSPEQYQETMGDLWNMMVIGLLGVDPPAINFRDRSGLKIFPAIDFQSAPETSLGYQVSLLKFLNRRQYRSVVIPKDGSCFYSAIAYHMRDANGVASTGSEISQGDWLRQVLGLLYLQYLILTGYNAEQLNDLVHPDVYATVASFANELAESKPEAIQASPLVAGHDPLYILQALTNPAIWGETEFSSLTAILLQQPVYLIEMQDQLFHLQLNSPNGTTETLRGCLKSLSVARIVDNGG